MTCFSDFMFLYVGNHEELSRCRFDQIPDLLTFTQPQSEFNLSLIENRFNFLVYNSKVYKNLVFNFNLQPKVFQLGLLMVKYVEFLLHAQSENYEGITLNPFLQNLDYSEGVS